MQLDVTGWAWWTWLGGVSSTVGTGKSKFKLISNFSWCSGTHMESSCENLHMQSKTWQLSSFLTGFSSLKILQKMLTFPMPIPSQFRWCNAVLQHAWIRHMTCSYLLLIIARPSTKSQLTGTWGSTSFQRKNGPLFSHWAMYWPCIALVIGHCLLLMFSQIFKDATLFFSHSTPNLATVIPIMDHIDAHLATAGQNLKFSLAIRASLALGKAHLNT